MGELQDCVVIKDRYFCWDNGEVVEIKVERLPKSAEEDSVRDEGVKAVVIKHFGLIDPKRSSKK